MRVISLVVGVGALVGGIYAAGYLAGKKKQERLDDITCPMGDDVSCDECPNYEECIELDSWAEGDSDCSELEATVDDIITGARESFNTLHDKFISAYHKFMSTDDEPTPTGVLKDCTQCDSREKDESICDRCDCKDLCGVHVSDGAVDKEFEECLEEVEAEDKVFENTEKSAEFEEKLPEDEPVSEEVEEAVKETVAFVEAGVSELKNTADSIMKTTKSVLSAIESKAKETAKEIKEEAAKAADSDDSAEDAKASDSAEDDKAN